MQSATEREQIKQSIKIQVVNWVSKNAPNCEDWRLKQYKIDTCATVKSAAQFLYAGSMVQTDIQDFLESRLKFCSRNKLAPLIQLVTDLEKQVIAPEQEEKLNQIIARHEALLTHLDAQRYDYSREHDLDIIENQPLAEVEVSSDNVEATSFEFADGLYRHLWKECPEIMRKENGYQVEPPYYGAGASRWICPKGLEESVVKAFKSFFGGRLNVVYHPGCEPK
jgi:hypothetical protein